MAGRAGAPEKAANCAVALICARSSKPRRASAGLGPNTATTTREPPMRTAAEPSARERAPTSAPTRAQEGCERAERRRCQGADVLAWQLLRW